MFQMALCCVPGTSNICSKQELRLNYTFWRRQHKGNVTA
jgi:hypothetical protein